MKVAVLLLASVAGCGSPGSTASSSLVTSTAVSSPIPGAGGIATVTICGVKVSGAEVPAPQRLNGVKTADDLSNLLFYPGRDCDHGAKVTIDPPSAATYSVLARDRQGLPSLVKIEVAHPARGRIVVGSGASAHVITLG